MSERYVFRDADVNELMLEIFNDEEKLSAREYKTIVSLDQQWRLSLEQVHLIMHVFFVDAEADVTEKIKMVAEVLLAGSELGNDYPEADLLEAKIEEVSLIFGLHTDEPVTQH